MLNIRNYNNKCLYDYNVNNKYKIEINELNEGEKASIVSDTMLKTMFQNENRLKYSVKLLSYILDISYDRLLKTLKLYKNDVDKDYKSDKNQRCDYVAEINGDYVGIEVNNNSSLETMERNIQYAGKIFEKKIKAGKKYNYTHSVQINLNNFSFEGYDKIIDIYGLSNNEGILLTKKIIIVQIFIPNLRKKWYTSGIKALSELERYILALAEPNIKDAKELGKGNNIMEDYVDESVKVCGEESFGESYDKELALMDEYERIGIQKGIDLGIKQGIEQGEKNKQVEIAENLIKKGIDISIISECTNLTIDEIEKLNKN